MPGDNFSTLFEAPDYRAFLQSYFLIKEIKLSDFARSAGCTRGFPSDILNGRRRLTAKSYYTFEHALKLPLSYKKVFQLLVAKEEPDIFVNIDRETIDIKLKTLRQARTVESTRAVLEEKSQDGQEIQKVIDNPHSITILVAAGDPETGATYQQILQRTRLPENMVTKTLSLLQEHALLKFFDDRYFPQDLHTFFETQNASVTLAKVFAQGVRAAEKRLSQIADNSDEMFFVSQFSIQEKNMPQFKKELKELVLKFVDDSIDADGNRIARLLTALHF